VSSEEGLGYMKLVNVICVPGREISYAPGHVVSGRHFKEVKRRQSGGCKGDENKTPLLAAGV
jgi:hypothetical protein